MFRRTLTNIGAGVALAAIGVLGTGAAAYAHECYNANRSEQGNAGAAHAEGVWYTLVVADVLGGELPPEAAECVLTEYTSAGGPASFTVMVKGAQGQGGTIASNNPHVEKTGDGSGIDTIFGAYGGAIMGAYEACGISL